MKKVFSLLLLALSLVLISNLAFSSTDFDLYNANWSFQPPDLHKAARRGDVAEIERLAKGWLFRVNAKDRRGRTALMYASFEGRSNIAALLIEKGANVNARDKDGATPLMYASDTVWVEVLNSSTSPMYASDTAALLIEKGADINARDKNGATPLIHASRYGREDVVASLIAAGADTAGSD